MSIFETILLPAAILALAFALARREWRLYRTAAEIGSDLFVYSRWRLCRRLGGVVVLVALAGTFVLLGARGPRDAAEASAYVGALVGEVLVLVGLSIWDLRETGKTARPEDLTRQGGGRSRTRRTPHHLP